MSVPQVGGVPDPNSQMENIVLPEMQTLQALLNSIQGLSSIPSDTLAKIANLISKIETQLTNIDNGMLVDGSGPDTDYTDMSFEGGEDPGFKNQDLVAILNDFSNGIYVTPFKKESLLDAIKSGDLGQLSAVLIAAQGKDGSFQAWLGDNSTLINDLNQ